MQDGQVELHPVEEVGLAVLAPERLHPVKCNNRRRRMPVNQMDTIMERGEETINR